MSALNEIPKNYAEFAGKRWGETAAKQRLEALNAPPLTSIRLHPQRFFPQPFSNTQKVPWHPNAHFLQQRPSFTLDPAFHAGAYYVQESASMMLKAILDRLPPLLLWLDLAAAPGGKSTLLLEQLNHKGWLLANEPDGKRFPILQDTMARWGYANQMLCRAWPKQLADALGPVFHGILLDAPCSGEGMFRKEPHARKQWKPELVQSCAQTQQGILEEAVRLLAPGGYLIYSTCTFAPEENQGHAQELLQQGLEPVSLDFPEDWGLTYVEPNGCYAYPDQMPVEGLFFMVWKKPGQLPQHPQPSPSTQQEAMDLPMPVPDAFSHRLVHQNTYFGSLEPLPHFWPQIPNLRSLGTPLAYNKNGRWLPHHGLALSLHALNTTLLPLENEEALRYLRGETPSYREVEQTWITAGYRGLPLGWLKKAGNRFNNHYPEALRIRMQGN
jgi:16S rRNA C967 or C1407 C5-methylase (RsmB/RsmF family)/NOL1/NOP2/fmu family ribosome biogenesis protein